MQIVNFKKSSDAGTTVATFDVYLGESWDTTYPNFKLKCGKTGGKFICRPGYVKSENPDGTKVYGSYPEMSKEKWEKFRSKVDELLKPILADQGM